MNGFPEFPAPQTLGRQRDLNTVRADPNVGKLTRPTQFEAQSLLTQAGNYINNWLGNLSIANKVKDSQSTIKAAKVSSAPSVPFSPLVDTRGKADTPFNTMADFFLEEIGLKVSSVEPAAKVPGRPPAPQTTNYQYANNIDKAIAAGGAWVGEQVKGFFNIAYEGPVAPAGVPNTLGDIGRASSAPLSGPADSRWPIIMVGILYLVTR